LRIERSIDAFLDWRQLEHDATPRSIDSYQRVLWKLAKEYPEADIRALTTADLRAFLKNWVRESKAVRGIDLSGATRSNIISVLHSFFAWAEAEDIIDADPSREDPSAAEAKAGNLPADVGRTRPRPGGGAGS
jgi:site-specific recombinase XerD